MSDVLTLGGIVFDDFSAPAEMMGGGKQQLVIHKLPGGSRSINTLGPDEANPTWSGFFYGNDAYTTALALDSMRAAGAVVPLTWGGQFRSVIIENFIYKVRKFPMWVNYEISCVVYQNPMLGTLTTVTNTIDTLILSDLNVAIGGGL